MKTFYSAAFTFLFCSAISQAQVSPVSCDTTANAVLKKNGVEQQWEYKVDKKTKKKSFNSLREFNGNGCPDNIIIPDVSEAETYHFNEWEYDAKGKLTDYREGKIDKDSAKTNAFSESYSYNFDGLLNRYRKETYEGEMSQTTEKTYYEYSSKGEKTEIIYTLLRVRKDTIFNDEIKYSGSGSPVERTINNYFPKGIADFTKYNSSGLPVEQMRYEKGKVVAHKTYIYVYDKAGQLTNETITDGIGKIVEKKKYEKDKITYTKLNTKGKVLNTSSLPYAPPAKYIFPSKPEIAQLPAAKKESPKYSSSKQKMDKKKNKVMENYSGTKLISTDTYNPKGLLIESNPADGTFTLQYEYVFY